MSLKPEFDLAILGAGCAGFSLAVRLCDPEFEHLRICIVEARSEFAHDRTWCGWKPFAHPFESLISHEWHRWKVATPTQQVIRESTRSPYQCIPSSKFYEFGTERIAANSAMRFSLGTRVTDIIESGEVLTDQGAISARLIIDTRPSSPNLTLESTLFQVFRGWELETAEPMFDPTTIGLMEFENSPGIRFLYTLPFSPTRALLEWTEFNLAPRFQLTDHEIQERLNERFPGGWREIRRESGCIPMHVSTNAPVKPLRRVLRIGADAGATRPATGYAFGAIQRQADQIVRVLRSDLTFGWPPFATCRLRPRWLESMDRTFLRLLRNSPALAPSIFLKLFQRCPAERLIRFLSDRASPLDALSVIASLPSAPFFARAR